MTTDFFQVLALDFDGVICDGLIEYFQVSKRTYCQIWQPDSSDFLDDFATQFYHVRPAIETGWEMPLLLRALVLGFSEAEILLDWHNIAQNLIESEQLDPKKLSHLLDSIRDNWIQFDLENWLKLHRFYPGIIDKLTELLNNSLISVYIVTTKEKRFVKKLLQEQGLDFPETAIFGKEVKRPKYEILRQLLVTHNLESSALGFVEDLLKTLRLVQQQPDLEGVKLYLADWGYNTQQIRDSIKADSRIKLLSLKEFTQDFPLSIN